MRYTRILLGGVAGSLAATVIWVVGAFFVPIFVPLLWSKITGAGGAAGASLTSDSVLLAAVIGFAVGAAWGARRRKG
jgi:hypothetical protein